MTNFTFRPKRKGLTLTLFLSLLFCVQIYAQNKTVTGKVTDSATGETLIGATVMIQGTKTGVATNTTGEFSILAPAGAVLEIKSVGYTPVTIPAAFGKKMLISMSVNSSQLNEVVVVGYGTKTKETLTGAISTVGEEVFKDRPVPNAALALQGEIPGLVVTRTSARPGNEAIALRLRGESSISAVSPLIVIDGVPVIGDYEFFALNPNDIESVTALKDGSAAIYGVRSQGGVILVTTKRGKGKMQISYNGQLRINTTGLAVPWANAAQWAQLYLQTSTQDRTDPVTGAPVEYFPQWTKANLQRLANGESFDYTNSNGTISHYADNNWQSELYGTSLSQQQNLSLRGASDKAAYAISLGYSDDKSILKTAYDGEKKYTGRINYDFTISDRIKWKTGVSFDTRTVQSPKNSVGAGFFDAPIFPTYNSQGQFYDDYGYRNPVAFTSAGGTVINSEGMIRGNTDLTIEILKGLKISGTAAITKRDGWQDAYNQTFNFYNWLGTQVTNTQYNPAAITETIGNTIYQKYDLAISYTKTFAQKHSLGITFANSNDLTDNKTVSASRTNLQYPGLYTLNTANTTTQTNTGTANHFGFTSLIGRLTYDYEKKYIVDLLGRSDASSKFDVGFRRGNFYNASAAWVISSEKFMRNITPINFLKIYTGYGETGGLAGLGNYDYLSLIGSGTALFGTVPALQQTAFLSGITSNQRSWERMVNKNIGINLIVLNNRLNGTFELYERKNIGALIGITYPKVLGGNAPTTNSGTFRTRGWDAMLNWKDKAGPVTYNVGFTLSNNNNLVVSQLGQDSWAAGQVNDRQYYPLNSLFVYKTDGYFATQAEADAYTAKYTSVVTGNLASMTGNSKLRAGDLKVVDLDGNGSISPTGDGKPGSGDVYFYGDADPHYSFGVNLGLQWKGIDISSFFQGVLKQNILRGGNARSPFFRNYLNVNTTYIGQTWTPENIDAPLPRLSFDSNRNNWNYQFNDVNIEHLRYIRLKSLIVGYTVPKLISDKLKLSRIRIYFSGNDLFTKSSVGDGFDPERGQSSDSSYPFIATYSFGLDLGF